MMGIGKMVGKAAASAASTKIAPEYASGFVRTILDKAIDGAGKYPGARAAADKQLAAFNGDGDRAISQLIENHVRLAGAQGFVTNLGGLVTMTVTIPANVTGLALLQCHMVAAIAHLRGFDLDDPRVRNAVLTCMMGEDTVEAMIKEKRLPSTPLGIATAPLHDPSLDKTIAKTLTSELIARVGGRRMVTTVGRRIPFAGGVIGASGDAFSTWRIGRYTDHSLPNRRR